MSAPPPLPPDMSYSSPAPASPKTGMSGCAIAAIVIAVAGVIGVFVIGILAVVFFAHAQNQGWNLFEREATQTSRLSSTGSRAYHK